MPGFLLRLARQWIAGEKLEDGINRAQKANSLGILGLLNVLGEEVKDKTQVESVVAEYIRLLETINKSEVKSQISIKPTQLGLKIDYDYCLSNYMQVADECERDSNWLWIDMESSTRTEQTISIYKQVLERYPNTGLAVQAYLKKSENVVGSILPLGAKIRLVKGAYNEPKEIALRNKREISDNFARLARILFVNPTKSFFAIATHDSKLIDLAKSYSKEYPANFEFEMLMGVRDAMKLDLVKSGFHVREYIPYGPQWLAYSMRRLREKKSNILLLARSLFSS